MTTPSKADVLRVAGEPVAFIHRTKQYVHLSYFSELSEVPASETYLETERLYTESQLLAMYAAGAEGMRELAAGCSEYTDTEIGHVIARHIRALPITPTNTEGEQA